MVPDKSPLVLLADIKNIYNSQYRVDLFPSELQSPGLIMVHFSYSYKRSLEWGMAILIVVEYFYWNYIILFYLFGDGDFYAKEDIRDENGFYQ